MPLIGIKSSSGKYKKLAFIITTASIILLVIVFIRLLPNPLFEVPYSTVIEDESGELLSGIIADDGQWRFPSDRNVPEKFAYCIMEFEDAGFFNHFGVSPLALLKATYRNLKAGKILSGGSTITMQIIRLSRKDKPRNLREKFIEMIMAIRLECTYSKGEILNMYCAHAPFGGNVVGLEAASWRYYGIDPEDLSWGQSATLAVLPNAPSLIYPGKNDTLLLNKRNKLLLKLYHKKYFSQDIYEMALSEPLPGKPRSLPQKGTHLLNRVLADQMRGERVRSTIKSDIQDFVQEAVNKHVRILSGNKVYNAAAIVIEVETGNILAYVGNSTDENINNNQVDMINALRSPGSTLKPLLYCAMLNEGIILPQTLVPDVPVFFEGFNPQNFNRSFDGAVSASEALSRSLNVPSVHMLKQYGIKKFNFFLKKAGITTLYHPSSYYGLSIILGGAEVKMDELAGVYASLARILKNQDASEQKLSSLVYAPHYIAGTTDNRDEQKMTHFTDAASVWFTFKAMIEVNRPDEDQFWFHFSSKNPVAWKTGTSYGERDAWAIGITPNYVVAVWAGNATGEGCPGLTGLQAAAPLMFEIFDFLPKSSWFAEPTQQMIQLKVCAQSGFKASELCNKTIVTRVPGQGFKTPTCPYHKMIHLDSTLQWQVNADCENTHRIASRSWFVLPAIMEYYFKIKNPFYASPPPFRNDCSETGGEADFGIIYPVSGTQIYLIDEMKYSEGKVVFKAAHRKADASLYWHLDNEFIGETRNVHNLPVRPSQGKHVLTVVDQSGDSRSVHFEILND